MRDNIKVHYFFNFFLNVVFYLFIFVKKSAFHPFQHNFSVDSDRPRIFLGLYRSLWYWRFIVSTSRLRFIVVTRDKKKL